MSGPHIQAASSGSHSLKPPALPGEHHWRLDPERLTLTVLRCAASTGNRGRRSTQDRIDQVDDINAEKTARDSVCRTDEIRSTEKSNQGRQSALDRVNTLEDAKKLG